MLYVVIIFLAVAAAVWVSRQSSDDDSDFSLKGNGSFSFEIVGEASYQSNLLRLAGGRKMDSVALKRSALLILEDDNQYDSNAVKVSIDGLTVGYFSRKGAVSFRSRLKGMGVRSKEVACPAIIVGGWDRGDGDIGSFGVKLDLSE